jgi:arabinogalactan endo-1,4-beta-galactosidase
LCCSSDDPAKKEEPVNENDHFYFGADLSYVNQVLDQGGSYKVNGTVTDPYTIFKNNGTNLVRVRLWHNPTWTKEVYGSGATSMYSDIADVEKTIGKAKAQGMEVLLDFHYSDTWADPDKQDVPAAWKNIASINVLKDSVYQYTLKTLQRLNNKGLLPEVVQIGNEINCGMLYTQTSSSFPLCNACNGAWSNLGVVLNAGIKAVRDVTANTTIKTKVAIHVADPKNVAWFFDHIKGEAGVSDFDIVGFSYYPLWHTTVSLDDLSVKIAEFKAKYNKEVMVLETAYPWTLSGDDSYTNLFGNVQPVSGYAFTTQGQYELLVKLTREVKDGGGTGVVYWEPAWITSNMKDLWGTGSAWENCTFFDFDGNTIKAFEYTQAAY